MFRSIIYLTLVFAFLKGIFYLRFGITSALNEAIPIFAIAIFFIVSYCLVKLFSKSYSFIHDKTNIKNSREWEIVKKHVPEVRNALMTIRTNLNEDVDLAEIKLKELFYVLGKDGLTDHSIRIIIDDVKKLHTVKLAKVEPTKGKKSFEFDALVFKFMMMSILGFLVFVFASAL
ncbi:hypothetical protein BOO35_19135 [Vibrio navarrensis]|nr:hypothetical protein [Vibrio navarrensis]